MDRDKPRDGLLEKAIEDATSIPDVVATEDNRLVYIVVRRSALDEFLARCGKIDDFLKDVEHFYNEIPDHMGRW